MNNNERSRFWKISRRLYRALPFPLQRIVKLSFVILSRFSLSEMRRRRTQKVILFTPPTTTNIPCVRIDGQVDYIIWGATDWHFRHQRSHQLAQILSVMGRRVFYVSTILLDDQGAGFEAEELDSSGRLFVIKLFARGAPIIYSGAPDPRAVTQIRQSIGEVLHWANCQQVVSLVDHPFWHDIAVALPNSRLIYNCMDYHAGFGPYAESLHRLEKILLRTAQLTITTSLWLNEFIASDVKHSILIRNACDYNHFSTVPDSVYRDPAGRKIIGYYGAIAEWFDLDLIETIAKQYSEHCVLLIGSDTVNAGDRLENFPNVILIGEVSYNWLPYYLHGFDICLLPFKVIPLTMATNPVKIYEYLGAGKSVVAVDLPEMTQFDGLIHTAPSKDDFVAAIDSVLNQPEIDSLVEQRKSFAKRQTWRHRAEILVQQSESSICDPWVSVVILTYNNLDMTRACLASLSEHSHYDNLEIIVVDNASSDGSPEFLSSWATDHEHVKLILNDDNRGFPAACNQGLAIASGEYLVLLNNDTYVTPGWVRTLVKHLQRDQTIGLIGPVTNNIGNEAKLDISYNNMDEMLQKTAAYTRRHIGEIYPLKNAAFFCVMMSRSTYEMTGPLDEIFGRGFFEDDDYCRRIELQGLRIVCAEDVFIHHHLSASFNKMKHEDRKELFENNKLLYERKWGKWTPHKYRTKESLS